MRNDEEIIRSILRAFFGTGKNTPSSFEYVDGVVRIYNYRGDKVLEARVLTPEECYARVIMRGLRPEAIVDRVIAKYGSKKEFSLEDFLLSEYNFVTLLDLHTALRSMSIVGLAEYDDNILKNGIRGKRIKLHV